MLEVPENSAGVIVQDMIRLVKEKKEGFYQYNWPKPGISESVFPKIAFIRLFEPYHWIIGTGEYLDEFEAEIKKNRYRLSENHPVR